MARPWLVALAAAGAVVLVLVVVVAVTAGRSGPEDGPAPAGPGTVDPGTAGTRLPSPDDSYWTEERMRSAQPAPMPTQ